MCKDLEEIPLEIGEIATLELIEIINWSKGVVESVKRIQQEQHEVGNDDLKITINEGIERGDALPGLRSYSDIAEVAKKVGFEVVKQKDLAKPPAKPWWPRLKKGRIAYWKRRIVMMVLEKVWVVPKGTTAVQEMLFETMKVSRIGILKELESNSIICLVGRNVRWNWNSDMQNNKITLLLFLCRSGSGGSKRWWRSAVGRSGGGGKRWRWSAVGRSGNGGRRWVEAVTAVGGGLKRSSKLGHLIEG
ncbi:hypothetical protein OSB04_014409 [Centaurea solstitialis]|uniref:Sterol methyltransferase C-terminal domain-containing protein n=1 Tax=Centaurea solstitialis TaxID=347529 RepID=A0AA38SX16_9ASTR|nr:hypothetical protein OSB04_014409 [Centaurea solstitialis]